MRFETVANSKGGQANHQQLISRAQSHCLTRRPEDERRSDFGAGLPQLCLLIADVRARQCRLGRALYPTSENRPDPAIWDRIVVPAPTDGTMAAEYYHAIDDGKLDHASDYMAEARNCTSSTTWALELDCSPLLWDGIRDSVALGIVRIPDLALDLLPKEPPLGRPLNTTKTVD